MTMNKKLRNWYDDNLARRRATRVLWISIGLTAALYVIPFGFWVAYPLTLFSTLVHELGHGLTAIATGGTFVELTVSADTSGVAATTAGAGDIGIALRAAGGLVGPAIFAAIGFAASGRERGARVFIGAVTLVFAVVLALFVRQPFAIVFVGLVVAGLGWITIRASESTRQIAAVFLSVQMALSIFSRGDYLFTDVAHLAGGDMPSDVAHMAGALGGPYWLWGMACGAFSVAVLWIGAWVFVRRITPKPVTSIAR